MDETIDWDEIEDAATAMFRTWSDRGDLRWAKECWGHFQAAGLTTRSDLLQETRTKLRLLALAWYYLDFCLYRWDEGYDDQNRDICRLAEDANINPVALGGIATSISKDALDGICEDESLTEYALLAAVRGLRAEVYNCLLAAYGDESALYKRMCQTARQTDSEQDDDSDLDATGYNQQAYYFVSNAFQL